MHWPSTARQGTFLSEVYILDWREPFLCNRLSTKESFLDRDGREMTTSGLPSGLTLCRLCALDPSLHSAIVCVSVLLCGRHCFLGVDVSSDDFFSPIKPRPRTSSQNECHSRQRQQTVRTAWCLCVSGSARLTWRPSQWCAGNLSFEYVSSLLCPPSAALLSTLKNVLLLHRNLHLHLA